ncbi:MAG: rRNA maturation RNase YbeY [Phycisphaerae bacterium]|nr:rRNA maturation RNase YbeY [Phycisphaerae bacterium]
MLTLREHQSRPARIGVAVVDDVQIAAVNRQYLGHHGPTDVISFDLSEDEDDAPLEGEIIISWETAARQAAERDHSIEAEALLYTVHGVLHLIGYDDQADDDSATMHAEEDRILTLLGLGAVYGGEARGNRQQGKT